jgi:signal transduction histidine kinase
MKLIDIKYQNLFSIFTSKKSWEVLIVLLVGVIITVVAVSHAKNKRIDTVNQNFISNCNDITVRLDVRFKAHAQLLRSSAAFFTATDTVTREQWKIFNESEKISRNLVGIQGVGYSLIIPKNKLKQHIQSFRENGFPDYNVYPSGDREIYTSIIYLEPFSGRNLRAFGYDMFSEPIRRKAMELSRDSDFAILSGKVLLVQETDKDVQAGTLMYLPVYKKGKQTTTVMERQSAIKGWVYSPYRMDDLMSGILGNWDLLKRNRIKLEIYDDENITDEALLFDSQKNDKEVNKVKPNLYLKLPIEFNGKKWTLQFTSHDESLSILKGDTLILLISGIIISILLSILTLVLINTRFRASQIQMLNGKLEKLNIDKDRFISILGHDLKNPFSNILGFSEILTDQINSLNSDEIKEIAGNINKSARITNNLLEGILMWARTQQGSIPFKPQNLSLSATCENILEILNPNAKAKNITINHSATEHITVFADDDMLKAILRNLVSNAIKFTNKNGAININATQTDSNVTISISDNGIGIKPNNLVKLFDISEVLSTTGTAKETGTGLGLLICKEFVGKHQGKIWVESEVGKGSDFKFTLPISVEQAKSINN